MIIANRKGLTIDSLDAWASLGKPASVEHWKAGRSAYELARDWIEGDAATAVVSLLSARPEFTGIELSDGVAEKRTQFDDDSRGPRNHDLVLRAQLPSGALVTVAVEGKADEAFDVPLWRYRENGLKRSTDTGTLARSDALVRQFFQTLVRQSRGSARRAVRPASGDRRGRGARQPVCGGLPLIVGEGQSDRECLVGDDAAVSSRPGVRRVRGCWWSVGQPVVDVR